MDPKLVNLLSAAAMIVVVAGTYYFLMIRGKKHKVKNQELEEAMYEEDED